MTSKTPYFDLVEDLHSSTISPVMRARTRDAMRKDIAALESAHAEELRKLREELAEAQKKMATMVCGTCRGTGCTHGYRGCTCHPCHVCQPKGTTPCAP